MDGQVRVRSIHLHVLFVDEAKAGNRECLVRVTETTNDVKAKSLHTHLLAACSTNSASEQLAMAGVKVAAARNRFNPANPLRARERVATWARLV